MNIDHFPFGTVTPIALFVHVATAVLATILQPVWKGDTVLDQWWDPASHVRLFTVKRREVRTPFIWGCIVTSRIAFAISIVSIVLAICVS